jgi:hypothetical protein
VPFFDFRGNTDISRNIPSKIESIEAIGEGSIPEMVSPCQVDMQKLDYPNVCRIA